MANHSQISAHEFYRREAVAGLAERMLGLSHAYPPLELRGLYARIKQVIENDRALGRRAMEGYRSGWVNEPLPTATTYDQLSAEQQLAVTRAVREKLGVGNETLEYHDDLTRVNDARHAIAAKPLDVVEAWVAYREAQLGLTAPAHGHSR